MVCSRSASSCCSMARLRRVRAAEQRSAVHAPQMSRERRRRHACGLSATVTVKDANYILHSGESQLHISVTRTRRSLSMKHPSINTASSMVGRRPATRRTVSPPARAAPVPPSASAKPATTWHECVLCGCESRRSADSQRSAPTSRPAQHRWPGAPRPAAGARSADQWRAGAGCTVPTAFAVASSLV